jgi:hypothetical protein
MSIITLQGGPEDGRTIDWIGGDVVELMPASLVTAVPVFREPTGFKISVIYRRSLRDSSVFVYQP